MLFDSQFLLLHIVFVLIVYISQGECADTKEILPTEEIFKVRDWKLERVSQLRSDQQRDDQFRLLSNTDFSPVGWKGLKIELYFTPVFEIFLKTMKSILTNLIKNSYYEKNKWVWFFPDISGIPDERAFETSLIYPNNNQTPSVDNIVESFYVNEELIYGSRQTEERKSLRDITTISGKGDCSRYTVNEKIAKMQGSITFSYVTEKSFVGLTLILIFRQKLKSLVASNLVATQQEDNQWTLQNFGVRSSDRNLTIVLKMQSEEMLENPSPLMIVFNGHLICGLYTYAGVQKTSSESEKDILKVSKLHEQNYNLLVAIISLTSLLTLVVFAGIFCIVYMCNAKWQISRDQNYSSESRGQEVKDLKHRQVQLDEHVCKCNDFDKFVTTEFANSSAIPQ